MIRRVLAVAMAVAGAACALAQPADDTTARVRKATADTQKQTAAVGALHQRVDVLEAQSAKASSELAAKDKAIADLRAQLAQAKAKGAAPAVSNRVPAPSH